MHACHSRNERSTAPIPMFIARLCTALITMASLTAIAGPVEAPPLASAWQAIAQADSQAALRLISDNHPGAAAELRDSAFLGRLALARQHVRERLPRVDSFAGYTALMQGMAADFQDGHIWSRMLQTWARRDWAGILPVRQGERWTVGAQQAAAGEPALEGAELLSCDGTPFDNWARTRIAQFGGNPAIEAELVRHAPSLLLNDGNPFSPAPVSCKLRTTAGAPVTLTLAWRTNLQSRVQALIDSAVPPAKAGMGISPFAGGYWISLGTLGDQAAQVAAEVEAQQANLRAAAMVVLDLRGNGGGNSAHADRIARALAGTAAVDAVRISMPACSGSYWRVSPDNLAGMGAISQIIRQRGDAELAQEFDAVADDMRAALREKRSFSPALPPCAATTRPTAGSGHIPPTLAMRGRLVLLTDSKCFSSCLIAVDRFRRLGALHVGVATDVSMRYMEVREIILPSKLRTFSTLQKVVVGVGDFGPYAPERVYSGSMADDEAVKAWVAALE